ncbi:hypothetical protein ASD39_14370 [Sphingomonas sp. Root50]|nr:hypothetical protein ASD17_11175 [Sphingomonas sp. Root1294]KQY65323.1 hypothetical protein ASD39_14370 [Sphingomonas sp. Root50]KRB95382.1 hypothetical protein ASE22_05685 [Sphingomonas sp. Root720]
MQIVTDRIAANPYRFDADADLRAIVGELRRISADATALLKKLLAQSYPTIGWGETEMVDADRTGRDQRRYWLFDPIDGAYHYVQGLPLWSASLALIEDGKPIFGAVYDPRLREMFLWSEGCPTTLNGHPVSVSSKTTLPTAVIGTSLAPVAQIGSEVLGNTAALITRIAGHCFIVRQMAASSLQLAYVAAGRLDAYVEPGNDHDDWIAGVALVAGAGGSVTAFDGEAFGFDRSGIVAASKALAAPLIDLIRD